MRIASKLLNLAFCACIIGGCKTETKQQQTHLAPPIAPKIRKTFEEYGKQRTDDYFWLNDPKNAAVLDYLNAENQYVTQSLQHTEGVQKKIYEEITGRLEQQSQSVPIKKKGYWYYSRFEKGKEYALQCRKKGTLYAPEEIFLNVPEMAKGHRVFRLFNWAFSDDNEWLAYSVDSTGSRQNTLYIKDLRTDKVLKDVARNVSTEPLVWGKDNKTLFYVINDETVRACKVMRHTLGQSFLQDVPIFEEKDSTFSVAVRTSNSGRFIFISTQSTTTSEWHVIDAQNLGTPQVIQPRISGLLYEVKHFEGENQFHILTNHHATNFKIVTTPLSNPKLQSWKDEIKHKENVLIEDFVVFKRFIIKQEKVNGLSNISVLSRSNNTSYNIDFGEEAYVATMFLGDEDNADADSIRYNYTSLTTPNSIISYHLTTRGKKILQEEKITGYHRTNYVTRRLWATAKDGTKIPISIVYKADKFEQTGSNPCFLYAYGSYGYSTNPRFSAAVVSLLDRGFVYAIAHVRGGQEMGRKWYENGKLLKKKNTYTDFIDCADFLINQKFISKDKVFANGGSAGGMLMGAIINMRPELWRGVIAEVPWIDVITDMFNDKLPLTTLEYDEWGNPYKKEDYDYMLSWSPYDNMKNMSYPNILATAGLHDTQVPYFSPAKWIAKMRTLQQGQNKIYLKTDMDSGHAGISGRFEKYKQTAFKYAFIFDILGITE
jgi:oligopeptidase B